MNESLYATFVIYYVVAIISISANLIVLIYLWRLSSGKPLKIFSVVLAYLHFSITFEELTAIPFIYKSHETFCLMIEAFKFYFGLKNILAIMILMRAYSEFVLNSTEFNVPAKHMKFLHIFLTFFPAIAFLPFTTGSYSEPSRPWCS